MRVPEPRALHRYLAAVSLIGCGALVAFAPSALDFLSGARPFYWILFALVLLGELRPIRVPRREAEISTATAFSYAALLAFGTPAAVAAQAAGSLLTDLVRRRPLSRAVFNVAQYTLSLTAAGAVLSLVGGVPFTDPLVAFSPSEIPAVVLARRRLLRSEQLPRRAPPPRWPTGRRSCGTWATTCSSRRPRRPCSSAWRP